MLDRALRQQIDPWLDRAGAALARRRVTANAVTIVGFALGLAAAGAIWGAAPVWIALTLFALSRLADGLDGAVARAGRPSDFGGFLDILLDFAFYGAIPLAFALRDPDANALAAAALLFSFYVNGSSFLAFAAVAARRGVDAKSRASEGDASGKPASAFPPPAPGEKALVFSVGLAEATETFAVFALMMLRPDWFAILAWGFAGICLATAGLRAALAAKSFR